MASIDALLRMIAARGAESLTIETDKPPALRRRGENEPMSMPPLADGLMQGFLLEVVPAERRGDFERAGRLDLRYRAEDGASFLVQVRSTAAGSRMVFIPGGGAAEAPAAPPVRAVPAVAPEMVGPGAPAVSGASPLLEALHRADRQDASDIILTAGQPARMRVGGELVILSNVRADDASILALLGELIDEDARAELQRRGSLDLALDLRAGGGRRYRVNLFRQHRGLAAAFRPIRTDPPTLDELSLPEQVAGVTGFPHGLVLVTGPAGSGKSTTLVALTERLNQTRSRHIITIEDPIEYEYVSQQSLVHQREVGVQVADFGTGLRAALRESPDVIVVGEMRDLDTIAAAITAAETGHLVLATLHTNRAADAIDRMIDVFPAHQQRQIRVQLASVLRAVVTQFLLPTLAPPERVPAIEVLVVNSAIAAMIRDDKCHQISSQIQTGRDAGMIPLERSLATLVRTGRISFEAAAAVVADPEELRRMLGR